MASPSESRPALGLRERKKAKTRAAIQRHALRLFGEQGFYETTVDQIAEAAEISPSTFFRYFPTKEAVALSDEYDPMLIESMRSQPPEIPPITAMRNALKDIWGQLDPEDWEQERARHRLIFAVPELRAAMLDEMSRTIGLIAEIVAEREGLRPDDFGIRVLSGALIGALTATTWDLGTSPRKTYFDIADATLAQLEQGLPFSRPTAPEPKTSAARSGRTATPPARPPR